MPRRRKANAKRSRRQNGRAPPNAGALTIFDTPKGFPHKLQMRHEYTSLGSRVDPGGGIIQLLFRANGMFDPDVALGGHQPLYFDQMCAIYRHYTVIRSTVVFEFIPSQTIAAAAYVDDDATVASSVRTALEQSTGKGGIYPLTQAKPHRIQLHWDAQEYFGGDTLDNDDLQGTVSTDPAEQSYFVFLAQEIASIESVTVEYRVKITYDAVWDELQNMTSS